MLCSRYSGFDSSIGGSAGHGRAPGADESALRAVDRAQPCGHLRLVRMNQPCAQLTGLSLADTVGRPFVDEVIEQEQRDWAMGKLRGAVAGQLSHCPIALLLFDY